MLISLHFSIIFLAKPGYVQYNLAIPSGVLQICKRPDEEKSGIALFCFPWKQKLSLYVIVLTGQLS